MSVVQGIATVLLCAGALFYLAGTVGLIRFPDVHSRLHALTKADNLGLGLVCSGLALLGGSLRVAGALLVIWLLGLLAATVSCHLIARAALGASAPVEGDDDVDGGPLDGAGRHGIDPGDAPADDTTTGAPRGTAP